MAAGPKQLAWDYMEMTKEMKEKLEVMIQGLSYASGWGCIDYDKHNDIYLKISDIEDECNLLYDQLKEIFDKYTDKIAEEMGG